MYQPLLRRRPLASLVRLAVIGIPIAFITAPAHAGGFGLIEHGASGLGNAYAGAAAVSSDGSTVWFNPAGMSEIDGREVSVALHILGSSTDWSDEGTVLGPLLGSSEVSGPDTASPGTTTALPNFYYVAPINDRWSYGLSIGVPFGSSTEYDDNWRGRYTTIASGVSAIDINPALSYNVSEKVRLGFGISLQQLSAELENSVDSGAVCLSFAGQGTTSISATDCLNNNLTPGNQSTDSNADITGDSVAFSFNMGALFLPADGVKIGVAYRHSIDHELDGDADFTVNTALRGLLDGNTVAESQAVTQAFLTDTGITGEIELPATFSVSGAWQVNDQLELLSDLTWTGWSSFQELRIQFDNPFQNDSVGLQEWEDVLRFSAGLNYQYSPKLTLRAGYAFDEEAIPGPERRTARIPGNDRTWFALGLGYAVSNRFSFDVGYARLTLDETPIANRNEESGGSGTVVRGLFDSNVNILSAQLNWDFN